MARLSPLRRWAHRWPPPPLGAALTLSVVALLSTVACSGGGDGASGGGDGGDDGWVVSSPAAEGMDAATLEGARGYAFADGKNTQGVVVVRHGRIVAEWYDPNRGTIAPDEWSDADFLGPIVDSITGG